MRSRKSKRVNSLSPAAIVTWVEARIASRAAASVVGADRLLEPSHGERLDTGGEALGLGGAERAVGVDHDLDSRTERFTSRGDTCHARLDRAVDHADAHLHGAGIRAAT